jgi:PBSX family phage terminase large subunit
MQINDLLPFSDKAKESIKDCGFLTVWEGAVRSSKTVASVFAFMLEVIKSTDTRFLMLGRSQSAVMANCIDSDYGLLDLAGGLAKIRRDSQNETYLDLAGKRIDLFGGENISSFKAFRGRTYGMVYVDEANLQHPNTIAECFNRTIASKSRKHFFTLNPDVPAHWLYTDYLDKYKEENQSGYRWFHFTLDDNPAISEERKAELKSQYTGVFYKRFILGLRVNAEGGCYPSFTEKNVLNEIPKNIMFVEIGADIGGNGSATTFSATAFFKLNDKLCFCCIDEVYDKENRSVEVLLNNWVQFVKKIKAQYQCIDCYVDSAEQLIRRSMQAKGIINVGNSLKAPIVDRIRFLDLMFSLTRAFIYKDCKYTKVAVESAVWDIRGNKETRLDNGTSNIDSIDAFEYSWERRMRDII